MRTQPTNHYDGMMDTLRAPEALPAQRLYVVRRALENLKQHTKPEIVIEREIIPPSTEVSNHRVFAEESTATKISEQVVQPASDVVDLIAKQAAVDQAYEQGYGNPIIEEFFRHAEEAA